MPTTYSSIFDTGFVASLLRFEMLGRNLLKNSFRTSFITRFDHEQLIYLLLLSQCQNMRGSKRGSGQTTEVDATGGRKSSTTIANGVVRQGECYSGKSTNAGRFSRGYLRSKKPAMRNRSVSRRIVRSEETASNVR